MQKVENFHLAPVNLHINILSAVKQTI